MVKKLTKKEKNRIHQLVSEMMFYMNVRVGGGAGGGGGSVGKDYSHYHCWNQNQPPACGQKLKDHKQCCLCDKIYKPRKNK